MSPRCVFITGSTGYIGRALISVLLARGQSVRALAREASAAVDLLSVHAALAAGLAAGIQHFVYVSVAHPAPVMRAYVGARQLGTTTPQDVYCHARTQ